MSMSIQSVTMIKSHLSFGSRVNVYHLNKILGYELDFSEEVLLLILSIESKCARVNFSIVFLYILKGSQ